MTELEAIPILEIYPNREKPLEVKIEIFEGPLELLLHMIRKKKVLIDEVRLADLTTAFMHAPSSEPTYLHPPPGRAGHH